MQINQRIKNRRKELGLSAEKVADIIGVSPATIYRYESADIMNMGIDKLVPLADALNTTPIYLITGQNLSNTKFCEEEGIYQVNPKLTKNQSYIAGLLAECTLSEQEKIIEYAEGLLNYRKLKESLHV